MGGAILVRGADELDRTRQRRPSRCHRRRGFRRRRSPGRRRSSVSAPAVARRQRTSAPFVFEGGHVDLDAELHVRVREPAGRQHAVEVERQDRRPGVVERMPRPAFAKRWMKMVEQRHGSPGRRRRFYRAPPQSSMTKWKPIFFRHGLVQLSLEHGRVRHDFGAVLHLLVRSGKLGQQQPDGRAVPRQRRTMASCP